MFQNILVPLDGSSLAEQALPVAARLARACSGTITFLHVVDVSHAYVSYGAMQPIIAQDAIERSLASGKDYLHRLRSRSDLAGVSVKEQVILGLASVVILSVLDEQAFDLVVMSSYSSTGVKRWILGSTAEKVVHYAPVPVLLLRKEKPLRDHIRPDGTRFVRALIPLDGSARSQVAIAPAAALVAALASPGQGELHLTQILVFPKGISETEKEALQQDVGRKLQSISANIRGNLLPGPGPNFHLMLTWSITLDRDIAEGIVRIAEHGERPSETSSVEATDLIAMATHGYTGIHTWTMGSIAERVLHATELPLLLVRPADMMKEKREESR
jgi:nucleotide-binding universal stress UspA family protein